MVTRVGQGKGPNLENFEVKSWRDTTVGIKWNHLK